MERLSAPGGTHSEQRSWSLLGLKKSHFELIRVHEGAHLVPETALHFLSEVNTRYVQKKGEGLASGNMMAIAVKNLIRAISSDEKVQADFNALVGELSLTLGSFCLQTL